MLINTDLSIAEIARKLTYDSSNFSKFFKKWTVLLPENLEKYTKEFPKLLHLPKSSPYINAFHC